MIKINSEKVNIINLAIKPSVKLCVILYVACGLFFQVLNVCIANDKLMPVEDLRLPVEYYPNGKIKVQLMAQKAEFSKNGDVDATKVKVEFYDEAGAINIVVWADNCFFSKETGVAESDSKVRIEKKDIIITGKGFEWNTKDRNFKIYNNARVVLRRGIIKDKKVNNNAQ